MSGCRLQPRPHFGTPEPYIQPIPGHLSQRLSGPSTQHSPKQSCSSHLPSLPSSNLGLVSPSPHVKSASPIPVRPSACLYPHFLPHTPWLRLQRWPLPGPSHHSLLPPHQACVGPCRALTSLQRSPGTGQPPWACHYTRPPTLVLAHTKCSYRFTQRSVTRGQG